MPQRKNYAYFEDYIATRFFQTDNPAAPMHCHTAIEIVISFRGSFDVITQDKVYNISEGDCIIIPPHIEHSYACDATDADVRIFIIPLSMYPDLNKTFLSTPISPLVPADSLKNSCIYALIEDVFLHQDEMSPLTKKYAIAHIASEIIDHLVFSDIPKKHLSFVENCLSYCQEHYKEPITLQKMAEDLHISYTHASYLFNKVLQQNFCTYVNKLRIADSINMLSDTEESISEIAFQCGFSCIRSFNQAFSKQTGITPTQFKNRSKK